VIDKRKDGSFYPAYLTISPIHDQSDSPDNFTHFVGIQSDLTQIEDIEARFQQAQKMEAIGTLVGGIAHDFNNILAGMTGNIYLARESVRALPDVVRKLDDMDKLAFRAAGMIAQLLAFARKSRVIMKDIPLTSYLKEALKLLAVSVPENIKLKQYICPDDLLVSADSTQIHQILMNLVNNARDALDGIETPVISIALNPFTADDAFVQSRPYHIQGRHFARISVGDNGCGIPANQIGHLFEPFFTTKEQGKGTGLGLSMVYGSVKGHNGFVEVESEEGNGSTFHVYLPISESAVVMADTTAAVQPIGGRGECILLVDDETNVRETGRDVLKSLGYKVLTAANGREAVELFRTQSNSIDLVILDVVMPVMSGPDACRHMRKIRPDIKVLFSTGYDKHQGLGQAEERMGAEVVGKPLSVSDLSRKIRSLLG